jgi:hypothetical protein
MFELKDLPVGKLTGGAQDAVELALAREIRDIEKKMGQPVNISNFVAAANERHGLVPKEKESDLTANIEHAYDYVTAQKSLAISRAGHKSYQLEGLKTTVIEVVDKIGSALGGRPPEPEAT